MATNDTLKAGRGGTLDILRFAAAFFIVLFHYGDEAPIALARFHPLFDRGHLATDFFLILSGYVLGRAYGEAVERRGLRTGEMLVRRIARIWPSHLIVLGGLALFVLAAETAGYAPHRLDRFVWSDIPSQALLIQAWWRSGALGWNIPTWSLSALVACYAVFPAAWRLMARLPTGFAAAVAVFGVLGADGLAHRLTGQDLFALPYYHGVLRALPLFVLGMAIALWARRSPLPQRTAVFTGTTTFAAFVALQSFGGHDLISMLLIAIALLCAGSLAIPRPSWTAATLGRISFSLFLVHVPMAAVWFGALHVLNVADAPLWARWAIWAASLPLVLILAYAFDRWADQPVQIWLKPRLDAAFRPRPDRYPGLEPSG